MTPKEQLDLAKAFLEHHYPIDKKYHPLISTERQTIELEKLKNCIDYEQFFFVLDLPRQAIIHANGLDKWLGYNNDNFKFFDYFKSIHPRHRISLNQLANSTFHVANSGSYDLAFMNHRMIIQIPLLHGKGKYQLFKRTLYPFQIDKSGMVTAYLNHFVLLRDYDESDSLDLRIALNQRTITTSENEAVLGMNRVNVEKTRILPFSKTEKIILKAYINNSEISHSELSELTGVNLNTLKKTHNSRIIKKARDHFQTQAFKTLKEVADYLKGEGLL
ncbi:hypothetical protein SAMN06298216_3537 [Spirosomataceae bacterium TFI 002]|nr:hypothetical protein SAMN06298216_3537 [Spirosomataceae bacterium TFI 002]